MRIVLDAMGGDYAPKVPVAAAVKAARAYDVEILLIGREQEVQAELSRHTADDLAVQFIHAPDVIEMHEHPALAVRRKKHSSIVQGMRLVRDGEAAAFVSAGHSGGVMAAATLILGRVPGVDRPALATIFPHLKGVFLLADVGANTDCRPEYLLQFARMGAIYADKVYGMGSDPRVGLVSNGEEETKGNRLVQEAHALLCQADDLNFVGNVEPKDMLVSGAVDVAVADGFVGNIVMKSSEAAAEVLLGLLREELTRTPLIKLAAMILRPAFRRAKAHLDYREYGGALLLGLKGTAIIAHGRSDVYALQNAVRVAHLAVAKGAVDAVAQAFDR